MTAVVGLDLSLKRTGIATPAGVTTVGSRGGADATLQQRSVRLHDLAMDIVTAVEQVSFRGRDQVLVVVEAPAYSSGTGHQHDRSGLWWLVMDELCGASWADVVEVTPGTRAKYATGKGTAEKDAVLAAVIRRYPDVLVNNNDEADALVLRAMGCDHLGEPLAVVPAVNRSALAAVAWPKVRG